MINQETLFLLLLTRFLLKTQVKKWKKMISYKNLIEDFFISNEGCKMFYLKPSQRAKRNEMKLYQSELKNILKKEKYIENTASNSDLSRR